MKSLIYYINENIQDNTKVLFTVDKYKWTEKSLGRFISMKCFDDSKYWFKQRHIEPLLKMKNQDEIETYLKKNQKQIIHPLFNFIQNNDTDDKSPKDVKFNGESINEHDFISALSQELLTSKLKKYIKFKV